MGFSTSGSLLVIFIALFVGLGTFYTSASNSASQLDDATADQLSQQTATAETLLNITQATWDESTEVLEVRVNNTGATELSLEATDLLVNGQYIQDWTESATVDGEDTDIWAPEEQLHIEERSEVASIVEETPEAVTIVTEYGIAERSDVEVRE